MKHLLRFAIAVAALMLVKTSVAQQRYVDEVFPNVKIDANVVFGQNYTVLLGAPIMQQLVMDIYEPDPDTLAKRPLIIYMHTGSFLPILLNQTATGDRHDSATVEMCKQFARRGYVVASIDYRLGWQPIGTANPEIPTGTLIQAVFRALQDQRTSVRFFHMNATTQGNTYRIDTGCIMVAGQGSGGYEALASATLHDPEQIRLPKFTASTTDSTYGFVADSPYVNLATMGDFNGIGGDPNLNYSNWPGYSSAVTVAVNMGGALGDSTWLVPGNVPMICFHSMNDPFAPYGYGPVIVPVTGQFVVYVSGSRDVERRANQFGNNDIFKSLGLTDPYTLRANQINRGYEGLFPFELPFVVPGDSSTGQAGPWEWVSKTDLEKLAPLLGLPVSAADDAYNAFFLTNPDGSKDKALRYIDTIQHYACPRMAAACGLITGIDPVNLFAQQVQLFPNPASDYFNLKLDDPSKRMQFVQIYDISGRLVYSAYNIKSEEVKVDRKGMSSGMYMLRVGWDGKVLNGKLILE